MSIYEDFDYLDSRFDKFMNMLSSIEQHAIDIIQSYHYENNTAEIAYNANRIVDIIQDLIEESDPWVCVGSYKYEIVDKLRELDKKSNYHLEIQKKIEAMEEDDFNNYYDYDEEKDDENRLDFKTLLDNAGIATIDDLFFD
jgi:actin-related protein